MQVIFLFGLVLFGVVVLANYATQEIEGSAQILDGDSLRLDGEEIRLIGIDAPEYNQECRASGVEKTYLCGRKARSFLIQLVRNRKVTCKGFQRDKYDRLLAQCFVGEQDLNREMVTAGWAVSFGDYAEVEVQSKNAKRGIWSGEFQNPADWRRDAREAHKQGFLSSVFGW